MSINYNGSGECVRMSYLFIYVFKFCNHASFDGPWKCSKFLMWPYKKYNRLGGTPGSCFSFSSHPALTIPSMISIYCYTVGRRWYYVMLNIIILDDDFRVFDSWVIWAKHVALFIPSPPCRKVFVQRDYYNMLYSILYVTSGPYRSRFPRTFFRMVGGM